MDKKQLKQRIVGAIVLIGLGVIFIPMILHQGDDASPITGSNIPPKPVELARMPEQTAPAQPAVSHANRDLPQMVDEHTPPVNQIDASVAEAKPESPASKPTKTIKPEPQLTTAEPEASKPEASKPETSKTAAKPKSTEKTRAWVVQVASFSEQKKAIKLRDRLRKAKHPTFVESIRGKTGLHYRVRVGPYVKRSKAEELKKKVAKQFKLKDALVMAHP